MEGASGNIGALKGSFELRGAIIWVLQHGNVDANYLWPIMVIKPSDDAKVCVNVPSAVAVACSKLFAAVRERCESRSRWSPPKLKTAPSSGNMAPRRCGRTSCVAHGAPPTKRTRRRGSRRRTRPRPKGRSLTSFLCGAGKRPSPPDVYSISNSMGGSRVAAVQECLGAATNGKCRLSLNRLSGGSIHRGALRARGPS